MYRCGFCGGFSKPNERQVKVTVETRQRTYDCRDKEGDPYQSIGYEIRRETSGHSECADKALGSESENIRNVRRVVVASKTAGNATRIRRFFARKAIEEAEEADAS